MIREAHEEAGLAADLIKQHAKPVGTINYVAVSDSKSNSGSEAGLIRAEIQYVYHLKVGPDVVPKPYDGEASDISLYSIAEAKKALDNGDFTPANACFILDFFYQARSDHVLKRKELQPDHYSTSQAVGNPDCLREPRRSRITGGESWGRPVLTRLRNVM
jgi:hypothetical protein